MSKVINLMEALGAQASFGEQELAVSDSVELDSELKSALLNKDNDKLNELLGVRNTIVCAMLPAKDDEPDESEEQDEVSSSENVLRRVSY